MTFEFVFWFLKHLWKTSWKVFVVEFVIFWIFWFFEFFEFFEFFWIFWIFWNILQTTKEHTQVRNRQSSSQEKAVRSGRQLIRQSGSLAVLQSGRPRWPGGWGLPGGRLFWNFWIFWIIQQSCGVYTQEESGCGIPQIPGPQTDSSCVHRKIQQYCGICTQEESVGFHKYRPHKQILLVYTSHEQNLLVYRGHRTAE